MKLHVDMRSVIRSKAIKAWLNLITERPATYLVGTTFLILVDAHWQVNVRPVGHKLWPVVTLYKWSQISVHFKYKNHRETQNVIGNDRWSLIAVVGELRLYCITYKNRGHYVRSLRYQGNVPTNVSPSFWKGDCPYSYIIKNKTRAHSTTARRHYWNEFIAPTRSN